MLDEQQMTDDSVDYGFFPGKAPVAPECLPTSLPGLWAQGAREDVHWT